MRYVFAFGVSMIALANPAAMAETLTIAVFTKNTTNPAYEAFRIGADQVGRALGARIVHCVPKKPDNVDEQKAFVEQVLSKSRTPSCSFRLTTSQWSIRSGCSTRRRSLWFWPAIRFPAGS